MSNRNCTSCGLSVHFRPVPKVAFGVACPGHIDQSSSSGGESRYAPSRYRSRPPEAFLWERSAWPFHLLLGTRPDFDRLVGPAPSSAAFPPKPPFDRRNDRVDEFRCPSPRHGSGSRSGPRRGGRCAGALAGSVPLRRGNATGRPVQTEAVKQELALVLRALPGDRSIRPWPTFKRGRDGGHGRMVGAARRRTPS